MRCTQQALTNVTVFLGHCIASIDLHRKAAHDASKLFGAPGLLPEYQLDQAVRPYRCV